MTIQKNRVIAFAVMFITLGLFGGVAATMIASNTVAKSEDPGFTEYLDALDARIAALPPAEQNFVLVAKKITPAVVTVSSERIIEGGNMRQQIPEEFRRFFRESPFDQGNRRAQGLGSGVIISANGLIITNNHVVENASDITITLSDRRELTAELVGRDPSSDIAVLKVDAENLPYAEWGNSDDLEVGNWVLAVGNPFSESLAHSVTAGIISATSRGSAGITSNGLTDFIQTDAAINPGNSGGALVNMKGEVIGINTAIITRTGQFNGIGLAVPSNLARTIADRLLNDGRIVRGYLGVQVRPLDSRMARAFGLDKPRGALIDSVQEGMPAAKAGLQKGDIVLEVNGEEIGSAQDLTNTIGLMQPNSTAALTVLRNGSTRTINVTLTERSEDLQAAIESEDRNSNSAQSFESLGLQVAPMSEAARNAFGDLEGVLVTSVEVGSAAEEAGLGRNVLITEVNGIAISSVDGLRQALSAISPGDFARIYGYVRTGEQNVGLFFVMEIPAN